MTRTHRTIVVAAAVAAIVVAMNASSAAYFSQSWGWVALAFLVPTTVLLILGRATVPGRLRSAFAVLMGGLAAWIALSSLWSLSTSASVRELERVGVYVAVAFAIALVLRRGDATGVFAGAFLGATGICAYGLATRLFPDRFGVVDDPFNIYRLAEPLGYWNSFGLLAAMAALLAVGTVAHARSALAAAVAAASLPLLTVGLYFTFSRGSWVALGFGAVGMIALDPRRVRVVFSILLVAAPSILCVALASRYPALTTEDSPPAAAAREGHRVAWILGGLVLASAFLGWVAHRVASRVPVDHRRRRIANVSLAMGAAAVVVVGVLGAGGPASVVSELRDRFEAAPTAGGRDLNERLFSISGNGRGETIGVAWDVGTERPVLGSGAGTFEYVWYERRPGRLIVRDAHSLYAETFSELGVVGLALLAAALAVPIGAAVRARRARYVAPAFGGYLAWVAAAGLDWHWEMVGLTVTAFLLGAVALIASERRRGALLEPGSRLALVGVTTTASALAAWSLVGNQALFAGRAAVEQGRWAEAEDHARRAQELLPWSHEPTVVIGDAAARRGDRAAALRAYREAVAQDPSNWVAWLALAQVARGAERRAAYDLVRDFNPREEDLPGE